MIFCEYFTEDDREIRKIREGFRNCDLICSLDSKPRLIEMILNHQKQHKNRKKEVIKNLGKTF